MYKKLIETYDWVSLFISLFHSDYNVVIGISKPCTNEIFTKREVKTSEKLDKLIQRLIVHHEIDYHILKDKFYELEVEMAYVNIYDIEDYVLQLVTYKNKPNERKIIWHKMTSW